jgi:multiple sugar transport system substrate-binding protein
MDEGMSPNNPGGSVPNPQNNWETPTPVYQAQPEVVQAPQAMSQPAVVPQAISQPVPPQPAVPTPARPQNDNPVVFNPKSGTTPGGNASGEEKKRKTFPIKKLLLGLLGVFMILVTVIVIFSLYSSGKSVPVAKGEVTLTYWGLFEDESTLRPVLSEFEQQNPNIKIVYEKQDTADYRDRLKARIENGRGPDVFRYHNTWYPSISTLLLPLPGEVITKDDFESKYYDVAKSDLIRNGAVYGIPLYTDTLSLYINTQLFEATDSASTVTIPKTWQEFINTSTALTKRNEKGGIEIAGAGIGVYENVKYAPDILSLLMAQNGVDLTDLSDYEEKVGEAIQFFTNFSLIEDNVWDSTLDNSATLFAQGRLAMFFGYSRDYFDIETKNPDIEMTVVPVPQLIRDDAVNIASYWAEGVSSQTKNPEESLLFMKFLAQPATQEKLYAEAQKTRDFGEPYSIVSFSEKLKDSSAFVFADQTRTAISSPFVEVSGENNLNSELNQFLADAVNNVLSGESDSFSAVDTFVGGYDQTVGQFLGD